eukprot:1179214-Prorocentrum_minimum.AAC.1
MEYRAADAGEPCAPRVSDPTHPSRVVRLRTDKASATSIIRSRRSLSWKSSEHRVHGVQKPSRNLGFYLNENSLLLTSSHSALRALGHRSIVYKSAKLPKTQLSMRQADRQFYSQQCLENPKKCSQLKVLVGRSIVWCVLSSKFGLKNYCTRQMGKRNAPSEEASDSEEEEKLEESEELDSEEQEESEDEDAEPPEQTKSSTSKKALGTVIAGFFRVRAHYMPSESSFCELNRESGRKVKNEERSPINIGDAGYPRKVSAEKKQEEENLTKKQRKEKNIQERNQKFLEMGPVYSCKTCSNKKLPFDAFSKKSQERIIKGKLHHASTDSINCANIHIYVWCANLPKMPSSSADGRAKHVFGI